MFVTTLRKKIILIHVVKNEECVDKNYSSSDSSLALSHGWEKILGRGILFRGS